LEKNKSFDKSKVLDEKNCIHIQENDEKIVKQKVYESSRVGLTLKGDEPE